MMLKLAVKQIWIFAFFGLFWGCVGEVLVVCLEDLGERVWDMFGTFLGGCREVSEVGGVSPL